MLYFSYQVPFRFVPVHANVSTCSHVYSQWGANNAAPSRAAMNRDKIDTINQNIHSANTN